MSLHFRNIKSWTLNDVCKTNFFRICSFLVTLKEGVNSLEKSFWGVVPVEIQGVPLQNHFQQGCPNQVFGDQTGGNMSRIVLGGTCCYRILKLRKPSFSLGTFQLPESTDEGQIWAWFNSQDQGSWYSSTYSTTFWTVTSGSSPVTQKIAQSSSVPATFFTSFMVEQKSCPSTQQKVLFAHGFLVRFLNQFWRLLFYVFALK